MNDNNNAPDEIDDGELDAIAGAGSLQGSPTTSEGRNGNAVAMEKIVIAHEGIDLVRG